MAKVARVGTDATARASIASTPHRKMRCPLVTSPTPNVKPLKVPDRHVPGFEAIRDMPEDDFSALLRVLDAIEPTANRREIDELVPAEIHLYDSDASTLLDAIIGLAIHCHLSQSLVTEIAERVACSPQLMSSDIDNLSERIERLLRCDTIRIYSKASAIGTRHERIFANAQILTDLRPVFRDTENMRPEPEGLLLSHTLNVHFIASDGTHDNFFVVLDDEDIESIRKLIDRAIDKAEAMRQLIAESGLLSLHTED